MRTFVYFVICVLSVAIFHNAFAQPFTSAELISRAAQYDGKVVVYEGEIIGDLMLRQDHAWLNINDGSNAIGIWVGKNKVQDIIYTGSYKSKGDLLEITGIFHRACSEHGGDLDIHAQAIKKISVGKVAIEQLNLGKRNLALSLLGGLCLVLILQLFKKPLKKK